MKKRDITRIVQGFAGWLQAGPSRAALDEVGRAESIRHLDCVLERRKATASAASGRSRNSQFGNLQLAEFKGAPTDAA
jgi:hypothetical protein